MKHFSILISAILLVSSCALFQAPITVTITNPHGFNIAGKSIFLTWGPRGSEDPQRIASITADSSGASYALTDYGYQKDFSIIANVTTDNGSYILGQAIIDTNATLSAEITLLYDDFDFSEASWAGPTIIAGGSSRATSTALPATGEWFSDTIAAGDQLWFKLYTTKDRQYFLSFKDANSGGGFTADLYLHVYDSNLNKVDTNHDFDIYNQLTFVPKDNYVLIKILANNSLPGTFIIGYDNIENVVTTRLSNNPESRQPYITGKLSKLAKK